MYCVDCGKEVKDGNKYCANCGCGIECNVTEEREGNVIRLVRPNEAYEDKDFKKSNMTKAEYKKEKLMRETLDSINEQERYANELLQETFGYKKNLELDYLMNEHKIFGKFRFWLLIGTLITGPFMIFTAAFTYVTYLISYLIKKSKLSRTYSADVNNIIIKEFIDYIKPHLVKEITITGYKDNYIAYRYKNQTNHKFFIIKDEGFCNTVSNVSVSQYIRGGLHINRSVVLTNMVRSNIVFNYHFEKFLKMKANINA